MTNHGADSSGLLFLTDEQLQRGIEAMFFAYRGLISDPDLLLSKGHKGRYGRAHHRAVHFIYRQPGTTVNNLLAVLGITKQSLNRVLRVLTEDGLVRVEVGRQDRRERLLYLTDTGRALEESLSAVQRDRMRRAYREAGPEAVRGFRKVLETMMDGDLHHQFASFEDHDG